MRHLLEPEVPVDALANRQEHVLGNAEGTACDGNQPSKRDVALLRRSDCSRGSRQELGRAGKDYHVLPPAVINADKQFLNVKKVEILDRSFFYPDGLKIERVENQTRSGRRNKCPDFHV